MKNLVAFPDRSVWPLCPHSLASNRFPALVKVRVTEKSHVTHTPKSPSFPLLMLRAARATPGLVQPFAVVGIPNLASRVLSLGT